MAKRLTLQQLERLCADGKHEELLAALRLSRFEDLRSFLGALGVKVRTRAYAAYRSKEDHVQLLADVLQRKMAADGEAPAATREVTPEKGSVDEEEDDDLAEEPQLPPSPLLPQQQGRSGAVDRVGGFLVAGAPMSSKDAERAYLVQCIHIVDDALTNVESKKEHVPGQKRALICELAYFVKRLKRIQEEDDV
ncbi:uncharacterized protein IUM83_08742 [Phytophthora cinnamomi]|uniref:uncharacterized protein n=1 Tax=Phytophthora cinnamomi TaxID=4785 RepID=UPI00355A4E80|nr:hypothetical protein IUM83_08742 [Phytophthora cinnamomi]